MSAALEWTLCSQDYDTLMPLRGTACVVEGEDEARRRAATCLRRMGFKTHETASGAIARFIASQVHLNVVIVDVVLPDINGLSLIRQIRDLAPDATIVAIAPQVIAGLPLFSELAHVAGADASLGPDPTQAAICTAVSGGHDWRPPR